MSVAASEPGADTDRSVSILTQTCVRPERAADFARWQSETNTLIAGFPGFIEQQLIPPNPPLQADWVILQRFATLEAARAWLGSAERQSRIDGVSSMLAGRDDVHIVQDKGIARNSPVSSVISTRVLPGKEALYRDWERRMAAAQSRAPGLQGYRFEPPIPGVQEDCVAILRFDTEAHLQAWLDSPERKKLVDEAAPLTQEFHARIARTGFEQWFGEDAAGAPAIPVWKQNMVVLLLLYPVVFLFSVLVQGPLLSGFLGLPFALALFLGNVVSVPLVGKLVPLASRSFTWWLQSDLDRSGEASGALLVLALYAAMVLIFWRLF